jgi:aspartate aminotransferase-like enzyme
MFSHRSEEYKTLHAETVELLQKFLDTENQVFLFSSTGTGFMEASVRNCVTKKMLCCINGSFGRRYSEIASSNGKEIEKLETSLGEPITPSLLDDRLTESTDIEAVSITHNETSTGLINPLENLSKVVKEHNKLLFVDAVSSMGGTEIKVDDWDIDVCFSSSQKCFGVPPGLAVGSISKRALKKSEKVSNKGWYFDFKIWERYQKNLGTPMTSVIPQILGLNRILNLIESWGGKREYFNLYAKRNKEIRSGLENMGLTLFPRKGYESPTVTCVNASENLSGIEIYERMREQGFELAKGYGAIKESTFRIGNMGKIEFEDIRLMLEKLETILNSNQS